MSKRDDPKKRAKMRFDGIQSVVMDGHVFWWTNAMAAVWMVIWAHENAKTWRSRTGYPLLRRELGLRDVGRPVRGLVAGGYLERMAGGHGSQVSLYRLLIPNIRFVDVPKMRTVASGKPWPADKVAEWLDAVRPEESLAKKYATPKGTSHLSLLGALSGPDGRLHATTGHQRHKKKNRCPINVQ